ncbi:MAG: hypothetical protein AAF986_09520, partial [Pseudomonadota bacterium]
APRDAMLLAGFGWLANQAIGFGFLGYPIDVMTLGWGVALGLSALAAAGGAILVIKNGKSESVVFRYALPFLAAWFAQQAMVFVASLVLGGTETAFAPSVVWFIFWTNAFAFTVLASIQLVGERTGMAQKPVSQFGG